MTTIYNNTNNYTNDSITNDSITNTTTTTSDANSVPCDTTTDAILVPSDTTKVSQTKTVTFSEEVTTRETLPVEGLLQISIETESDISMISDRFEQVHIDHIPGIEGPLDIEGDIADKHIESDPTVNHIDRKNPPPVRKATTRRASRTPCKSFEIGRCTRGSDCWFSHITKTGTQYTNEMFTSASIAPTLQSSSHIPIQQHDYGLPKSVEMHTLLQPPLPPFQPPLPPLQSNNQYIYARPQSMFTSPEHQLPSSLSIGQVPPMYIPPSPPIAPCPIGQSHQMYISPPPMTASYSMGQTSHMYIPLPPVAPHPIDHHVAQSPQMYAIPHPIKQPVDQPCIKTIYTTDTNFAVKEIHARPNDLKYKKPNVTTGKLCTNDGIGCHSYNCRDLHIIQGGKCCMYNCNDPNCHRFAHFNPDGTLRRSGTRDRKFLKTYGHIA